MKCKQKVDHFEDHLKDINTWDQQAGKKTSQLADHEKF